MRRKTNRIPFFAVDRSAAQMLNFRAPNLISTDNCHLHRSRSTQVNLVLWYKDGLGKPLYSFDLRGDMADPDGKIWASAEVISGGGASSASVDNVERDSYRAQLHTRSEPTAVLSLLGVTEGDAGSYRCRVDFKRSPTRYWKVVLQVIGEGGLRHRDRGSVMLCVLPR